VMPVPEMTVWMELPGGGRNRSFHVDDCEVRVSSRDRDHDARAAQLTNELAAAAVGITGRWAALEAERNGALRRVGELARENARLLECVPPPQPARLLGPGCVRFSSSGELWLLNKREGGWSSWGVRLDGWDDLFRRYAAVITEHGVDEHGAYWIAEPEASR